MRKKCKELLALFTIAVFAASCFVFATGFEDMELENELEIGSSEQALYNIGSFLEIEVVFVPGQTPPDRVVMTFPEITKFGVPSSNITLDRRSITGGAALYALRWTPPAINLLSDMAFVAHSDQWDSPSIHFENNAGSVVSVSQINELRITRYNENATTPDVNWHHYHFVKSCTSPYNHALETTAAAAAGVPEITDTNHSDLLDTVNATYCNKMFPVVLQDSSSIFELGHLIKERRHKIAEFVSGRDFDQLPLIIRESADDIGQSATIAKYDETFKAGACSTVMGYPQINYTYDFTSDFSYKGTDHYACDATKHRCWNEKPVYPNPDGTIATWFDVVDDPNNDRKLARINFTVDVNNVRDGFEAIPFEVVQSVTNNGEKNWTGTGTEYFPKAGDMIWRFDRCWHGSNQRHAMTLVDTPTFVGGIFNLPIWDGAFVYAMRIRDETATCQRTLPNVDLAQPLDGGLDSETNREFWRVGASDLFCPDDSGTFRYEYYIGETYNFEELAVLEPGDPESTTWKKFGDNLYNYPIDPDLQIASQADVDPNPELTELRFEDFDGDSFDDMFWRTSDAKWKVSLSSEDYEGWIDVGNSSSTVLECDSSNDCGGKGIMFLGDFGTNENNSEPDGKTDIVRLRKRSGGRLRFDVSYWREDTQPKFHHWTAFSASFSRFGGNSLKIHADNMVAKDFDGDGLTDIFFRDPSDSTWKIFYSDLKAWRTVKRHVPQSISYYQFADINKDGKTEVIKKLNNHYWQKCGLRTGWWGFAWFRSMGFWSYIPSTGGRFPFPFYSNTPTQDVRFIDLDGSGRLDFFRINSDHQWQVNYDFAQTSSKIGTGNVDVDDLQFPDLKLGPNFTDILSFRAL